MNKFTENIIFSFFVTLPMVMMDGLYHLATHTAVHLNYMAVKFAIIYLVSFLTAQWVGKGFNQGVFSGIAGPVLFFIYYLFAFPTLNREVFVLDDGYGYIFLHAAVMFVAYAVTYWYVHKQQGTQFTASLGKAFLLALLVFGADAGYQLAYTQFTTGNDELTAHALAFAGSMYLVMTLFLFMSLVLYYVRRPHAASAVMILGAMLFVGLFSRDIIRIALAAVSTSLFLYLLCLYTQCVTTRGVKNARNR